MSDFLPALVAFAVLAAVFVYGYLTDPYRPRRNATAQPAYGEPHHKRSSLAAEMSEIG